jgi:CHAT domain-containing protein/uncharacterized protein HemY
MRLIRQAGLASRVLPILALAALASVVSEQNIRLEPGKTVQGELSGGQSQDYSITLEANQYLYALVTQSTAVVVAALYAPDGKKELEVNTSSFPSKPTRIVWIADAAGEYRVSVSVPGKTAGTGHYEIRLEELRAAGPDDRKRMEAERSFAQGLDELIRSDFDQAVISYTRALGLYEDVKDREREGDTLHATGAACLNLRQYRRAIDYYERALAIRHEIKDRVGESATLNNLGICYSSQGQFQSAVDSYEAALSISREMKDRQREATILKSLGDAHDNLSQYEKGSGSYEQALAIFREVNDSRGEGNSLDALGVHYVNLGQYEKGIGYYEQALAIRRTTKDRNGESLTLGGLGDAYTDLSQYEKAIGYYQQALETARDGKARRNEGSALLGLGNAHDLLGQYEKAGDCYEQALAIFREIKDPLREGRALGNIGIVYKHLSQYEKAIGYYEQALVVKRELKDRRGEGGTLTNLGNSYRLLGQYEKAIGFQEQALAIAREIKDRPMEDMNLTNLGLGYSGLSQYQKAIGYFEEALAVQREIKDRVDEGEALAGLGSAYYWLSQYQKAIGYYEEALTVQREIKARADEGAALNNLGEAYLSLSQYKKAIDYYAKALAISREVKDRRTEAQGLAGLMATWQASGSPRLAIFYGKQAVNTVQSMRSDIAGLSQDLQKSFLKGNEKPYHTLAELLIAQGRLAEAEQVLALLKEEEYFEFIRRDAGEGSSLNRRADLTPDEVEYEKRYREIGDRLMAIGAERGELLSKRTLTPEESQRLATLERDLAAGNVAFEHFLGDLNAHFSATPELNARTVEQLREQEGFMEDLRELPAGTVAVYTLEGEDRLYVILRTPDAQKAYEYPIKAEDLNRKVFAFREAAGDPDLDPRPLAQELYQILVAPMAEDLRQAKAQTLMWSLDGAMRYVPIAALYDGKQYLIELYRVSVMTLASHARLKDRPDVAWSEAGFGVTKKHEDSEALPEVASELEGVQAILHGEIKLDEQFTEGSMRATLLKRYPVVHIASHFRFQPGDQSKSFLLLGDGGHLSLADLKSLPNLFGGVQLLTLSACSTGVGDGAEVEGFGTLAQQKGAKAVIASLWPVADSSTSRLMQEFYRIRESSSGMTKLEALREAQLELLHGEVQAAPAGTPGSSRKPNASYAHPFYWAPFFLMGNWL